MVPQEEPKPSVEIEKLLASLEESRRGLDEAWQDLNHPLPQSVPAQFAAKPPPARAPQEEALHARAQGEGRDARRDFMRKLFLKLRDERRRLEETRRELRTWTEDLRSRYAMLAQAEAQLVEQRLRHQEEALREERRRLDEDKLRFERDRLAEQQRRLDDDRRRDGIAAPLPAAPAAAPLSAAPPARTTVEGGAPKDEPARPSAPAAIPPPKWGAAIE